MSEKLVYVFADEGAAIGVLDESKGCIEIEGSVIIPTSYYEKLIAFEPPTLMERIKGLFIK